MMMDRARHKGDISNLFCLNEDANLASFSHDGTMHIYQLGAMEVDSKTDGDLSMVSTCLSSSWYPMMIVNDGDSILITRSRWMNCFVDSRRRRRRRLSQMITSLLPLEHSLYEFIIIIIIHHYMLMNRMMVFPALPSTPSSLWWRWAAITITFACTISVETSSSLRLFKNSPLTQVQ